MQKISNEEPTAEPTSGASESAVVLTEAQEDEQPNVVYISNNNQDQDDQKNILQILGKFGNVTDSIQIYSKD